MASEKSIIETLSSNISSKVVNATKDMISSANPSKLIKDASATFTSRLTSELPEASSIFSGFSSVVDAVNQSLIDKKNSKEEYEDRNSEKINNSIESLEEKFSRVEPAIDSQTSELVDMLYSLVAEVKTLADITGLVWDVQNDLLNEQRNYNREQLEQSKLDRFDRQTKEAQLIGNKENTVDRFTQIVPKEEGMFERFIQFTGMKHILDKLKGIPLALSSFFAIFPKFINFLVSIPKQLLRGSKGLFVLAKTGLKFTGVGTIAVSLIEGIFGAITEGWKSFASGDNIKTIIRKTIVGFISGPIQGIIDLFDLFFKIPEIRIADKINEFIESDIISKSFVKVINIFSDLWNTSIQGLVSNIKNIGDNTKYLVENIFESIYKFNTNFKIMFTDLFDNFNITNLFDPITNFVSESIDNVVKNTKNKFSKIVKNIKNTFVDPVVEMFSSIRTILIESLKSMMLSIADNKVTRTLQLDSSLKNMIDEMFSGDNNSKNNYNNKNINTIDKQAIQASSILQSQNSINSIEAESLLSNIRRESGIPSANSGYGGGMFVNNNSNNYFSQRIITRNPESPLFLR